MRELNMGGITLTDCLAIFRRWQMGFRASAGAFFVAALIFAAMWSNYRSTAAIQIDQTEVLPELAAQSREVAQKASAAGLIRALQPKALSTEALVDIIKKYNLYASDRQKMSLQAVAEVKMRPNITFKIISLPPVNVTPETKEVIASIALLVSFDYHVPYLSQQVADEIATRFIEQDVKDRSAEMQGVGSSISKQIAAIEESMLAQKRDMDEFQNRNTLLSPETLAKNKNTVTALSEDLQAVEAQSLKNEKNEAVLRERLSVTEPYARNASNGAAAQILSQIEDLRANIAATESTYGADHPAVVVFRSRIQRLESQLAGVKRTNVIVADADNPAYLQIVAQMSGLQAQRQALVDRRKDLQDRIAKLQQVLIQDPAAQQEYEAMLKEYEMAQAHYLELKEKKMSIDMSEQMQKDKGVERLTMIGMAMLPGDTHPKRMALVGMGAAASVAGALLCVVLFQILSQSIIGPRNLRDAVGAVPLACIPRIPSREDAGSSMGFAFLGEVLNPLKPLLQPLLPMIEKVLHKNNSAKS